MLQFSHEASKESYHDEVIDNSCRANYNAMCHIDEFLYNPFIRHCGRYLMASAVTWQSNPPEKLLKDRFHISTGFHPGQRDIIEQLIQSKRLLVIQRTGWGKSLCYQMASLYYPYLTLVFSPLKALMRDQCQRCNKDYAIPAAIVSSEFSQEENKVTPKSVPILLFHVWGSQISLRMIPFANRSCAS